MMTPNGTFVINGAERVVVSQLARSPGIYFVYERNAVSDRNLFCQAHTLQGSPGWSSRPALRTFSRSRLTENGRFLRPPS